MSSTVKNPEVRIKYGWLLVENASKPLNELWGEGEPLRSDDEYLQIVDSYQKEWKKYEVKILNGVQKITGLQFRQNVIDVYIAPWFIAFSDPMVIGVTQKPDKFIDVLTHELIHRILTDNLSIPHDYWLLDEFKKLFGAEHDFNTVIHIPVHAIHEKIYLDTLKEPARLHRDKFGWGEDAQAEYSKAWDYVEKEGADKIIERLKKSYAEIAKNLEKKK